MSWRPLARSNCSFSSEVSRSCVSRSCSRSPLCCALSCRFALPKKSSLLWRASAWLLSAAWNRSVSACSSSWTRVRSCWRLRASACDLASSSVACRSASAWCSAASRMVFCRPSTAMACSLRSCFTRASWVAVTSAIWAAFAAFKSSTSLSFFVRRSSIRSWWLLPSVSRSSVKVAACLSVRSVTTLLWSADSFATSCSLSWRASSSLL
mmetsp:Transcript_48605/g.128413  ORF Transcript_48605/g.128413 Transcript_48605/m.128413 type:complete len:209 (-) Transcript_48605:406-1032(-)